MSMLRDRFRPRGLLARADVRSLWLGETISELGSTVSSLAIPLLGGCAAVFFDTSYQVFLPSLLDGEELAAANALMHGSQSATHVGGPGLAGLLASAVGTVSGVLLNALSFLVSAVCLLSLGDGEHRPAARERAPLREEIAEGARFVARDPYLRVLTVWGGLANFALVGYQSVLIVFLVRDARLGSGPVGLLIALTSLGGVVGAALAPRLGRRLGTARAFIGCELIAAPAALLIGFAGPGPRAGLFAIGGFLVVAGVVGGNVLNATWSQTYTPRELRGRVSTCSGLINYGAIPLGALCAGTLATALGTHDSIWIMTATLALCPMLLLLSPLHGRRDFPAASGGRRQQRPGSDGGQERVGVSASNAGRTSTVS